MKIFISGLPKSGKTTLIKKLFQEYSKFFTISGFYTEEILKNEKRIGFKIFSIDLNKEFIFASKEMKTNIQYAGYYLFLENLEKVIDSININSKIILIDEIGKMEMLSKKFENFILEILGKEVNVIATLHRAYLNKFSKFGRVFWLERSKFDKIIEEIKKEVENIK